MRQTLVPTCLLMLVITTPAAGSPAEGVTPELLARGTYKPFELDTGAASPVVLEAKARSSLDIVVRKHTYAPGGHTGWHRHPAPVLITVTSGTVTFYAYDDPTCTPTVVRAGEGYVDDGRGHIGVNRDKDVAVDVSVILAPVAGPFRSEQVEPAFRCF